MAERARWGAGRCYAAAVRLLQAIPNVSEGRRLPVVDALADALTAVPGVTLLDRTSDPSHNRAVFTLAGDAAALETAALALARAAVAGIDLRHHQGVHPRVGALDVLPFVPLGDASLADAVGLARRTGARIADELAVPVYLYEAAAARPARRPLEAVRRGGTAGLAARMQMPEWRPDYGPWRLHASAGATCVAARGPLVAWNLTLRTDDLAVAREIARGIRASGGGLGGVKALGLPIAHRNLVQVSMNLTDLAAGPMHAVYARVHEAAARRGIAVADSEIIGLVPRAALEDAARHEPWLGERHRHQVLEDHLARAGLPALSPHA